MRLDFRKEDESRRICKNLVGQPISITLRANQKKWLDEKITDERSRSEIVRAIFDMAMEQEKAANKARTRHELRS